MLPRSSVTPACRSPHSDSDHAGLPLPMMIYSCRSTDRPAPSLTCLEKADTHAHAWIKLSTGRVWPVGYPRRILRGPMEDAASARRRSPDFGDATALGNGCPARKLPSPCKGAGRVFRARNQDAFAVSTQPMLPHLGMYELRVEPGFIAAELDRSREVLPMVRPGRAKEFFS
jgi:hypothetical protein